MFSIITVNIDVKLSKTNKRQKTISAEQLKKVSGLPAEVVGRPLVKRFKSF
jgi:ribosomal protein L5